MRVLWGFFDVIYSQQDTIGVGIYTLKWSLVDNIKFFGDEMVHRG